MNLISIPWEKEMCSVKINDRLLKMKIGEMNIFLNFQEGNAIITDSGRAKTL